MQARGAYLEPVGAVLTTWEREWLQPRRLGSNGDWRRALDRSVMGHGWTTLDVYRFVRMRVYNR
jgi:hypothetical protein